MHICRRPQQPAGTIRPLTDERNYLVESLNTALWLCSGQKEQPPLVEQVHVGISCSKKEKQAISAYIIWHLETASSFWRNKSSLCCCLVLEMVTRTVSRISKEIILFATLLPVLTNVHHLSKISLLLSLHVVHQWEGRESLPPHDFQLETGNGKWILDPLSTAQNLNPKAAEKNDPCRLWTNRLHMEILTRSWGRLRPELLKKEFTAATNSWFSCRSCRTSSDNYRFWHPAIGWKCWIYLHFINIQT